jgi:hypothetical protein
MLPGAIVERQTEDPDKKSMALPAWLPLFVFTNEPLPVRL